MEVGNDISWQSSKTVFGQTDATGGQLGCEVGGTVESVGSVNLTIHIGIDVAMF